jgi:hypothetical protein|uniref:Uncharacterized protein n=1 Tax=Podoviridae sp. ctn7K25 TaxID=2825273 RepID=A0A8S5QCV0_9CAUD|nr:MAG TPA: hypothetical protein [Podoviridae sp. ctn7K25]
MAESKEVKTKRELALERMKGKYPDKQFDDDEALFGQINDDYDDYDNQIQGYKDREQSFSDLFTSDPRSAKFLTEWRQGKNPAVALVEMFGDDFVEELKDPEKQEEVAEASKAYAESVSKEKDYEEQYNKNIEETRATVEKLQSEEGMSDEEVDAAMEFLITIMKDGILGKFSEESIRMALKAINHDADVDLAGQEGELRGKNAKISEKLRKGRRGDGTASLDGKNGGSGTPRQAPELGALGGFDGRSIFERGGERRTKYK